MSAASGGRLAFSLMALAVLMASGAAGVVMTGPDRGHDGPGAGTGQTRVLGAVGRQADADEDTAPPASTVPAAATAPGRPPAGTDSDPAGRFNVAAPHSPED